MFPIRDTVRARQFPVVNYTLIAANVVIFVFEASLGERGFNSLVGAFGVVPARLPPAYPLSGVTLLTSIFLHGSWFHLISNMWILYIFGDNVEDRMGSLRYLGFYLLAGVVAGLTHAFVTIFLYGAQSPQARLPTVGASGAIAGVLGAYIILYPRARVTTLIMLLFLPWFVEIPAFIFLGIWFVTQLQSGLGLIYMGQAGQFSGIAWWAHIGGFVFGLLLVRVFARRRREYGRWYRDEYWPW